MPHRTTKNISLTPELGDYVDQAVASGEYQTASEVVRAGLRLLRAREPRSGHKAPPTRPVGARRNAR